MPLAAGTTVPTGTELAEELKNRVALASGEAQLRLPARSALRKLLAPPRPPTGN